MKNIKKQEDGSYIDTTNNNRFTASFISKKELKIEDIEEMLLVSREDCNENCIDCESCRECTNCNSCINCEYCSYCNICKDCYNCEKCEDIENDENCINTDMYREKTRKLSNENLFLRRSEARAKLLKRYIYIL